MLIIVFTASSSDIPFFWENNIYTSKTPRNLLIIQAKLLVVSFVNLLMIDNPPVILLAVLGIRKIKMAAVMHKTDKVGRLSIFPNPIMCSELTVKWVFKGNIVAGIVTRATNIVKTIILPNMNRVYERRIKESARFMVTSIYLYLFHSNHLIIKKRTQAIAALY